MPAVEIAQLTHKPAKSIPDMVSLIWSRLAAQSRFSKIWTEYNVDFILAPPAAHTAVPHDTWTSISYTAFFNYLDWPAAVLPVGRVSPDDLKDSGAKYGVNDEKIYSLCKQ